MEIRHLCQKASGSKVNKVIIPKPARHTLHLQFALCVCDLQSLLPNHYKSSKSVTGQKYKLLAVATTGRNFFFPEL